MPYDVSITNCSTYDDSAVRAAIEQALAPLGGLGSFVRPGQRVLLKPNLLAAYPPERAVTTHPAIVRAVVRMVQELGAVPLVGDSPGGTSTPASYQALLRQTGLQQVIEETGCTSAYFDGESTEIACERGRLFKRFEVVKAPLAADLVIGLPKLKTHQLTYMTGAVKLLYGYLPGFAKVQYHLHAGREVETFAELLLDLHEVLPPALSIMDAVVAMEGLGPSSGQPRQVGLILASASCPALDYVAAEIIGLTPPSIVPTIQAAIQRGVGPRSLDQITLHGAELGAVRIPDFLPAATVNPFRVSPWIAELSRWLFSPRPVIDRSACVKCGKCVKHCPPKAMAFAGDGVPRIDYGPCLRCFCCHELCPVGAVHVAKGRLRFPDRVTALFMAVGQAIDRRARSRRRQRRVPRGRTSRP